MVAGQHRLRIEREDAMSRTDTGTPQARRTSLPRFVSQMQVQTARRRARADRSGGLSAAHRNVYSSLFSDTALVMGYYRRAAPMMPGAEHLSPQSLPRSLRHQQDRDRSRNLASCRHV